MISRFIKRFETVSLKKRLLLLWLIPILLLVAAIIGNLINYTHVIDNMLLQQRIDKFTYLKRASMFSLYAEDTSSLQDLAELVVNAQFENVFFINVKGKTLAQSGPTPLPSGVFDRFIASDKRKLIYQGDEFVIEPVNVENISTDRKVEEELLGYIAIQLDTDYIREIKYGPYQESLIFLVILLLAMLIISGLLVRSISNYFQVIKKVIYDINNSNYQQDDTTAHPREVAEILKNLAWLNKELDEYGRSMEKKVDQALAKERKVLKEIENQNDELVDAKRKSEEINRSKSLLIGKISHELKTPLNVIDGFSQLSLNEPLSPKVKDNLAHIQSSAKQMNVLINDLLELSMAAEAKNLPIHFMWIDLQNLLHNLVFVFKPQAEEKGLSLTTEVMTGVRPYIYIDELRLQQILNNLVSNAIKYTSKGGVSLKVEQQTETASSQVITISVNDSGIGIDKEYQQAVFESYYRVEEESIGNVGYGLGLPIVQHLAQALDAQIQMESEVGKGTSVSIQLDVKYRTTPPPIETQRQETDTFGNVDNPGLLTGKQVLIVEDHDFSRLLLIQLFENYGMKTFEAKCGEEAIELLSIIKADLIVTDFHLPDMTGFELAKKLKELIPVTGKIKILFMTADTTVTVTDESTGIHKEDLLYKPLDYSKFIQKVAIALMGSPLYEKKPTKELVNQESVIEEISRLVHNIKDTEEQDQVSLELHKLKGIIGMLAPSNLKAELLELVTMDQQTGQTFQEKLAALCVLLEKY